MQWTWRTPGASDDAESSMLVDRTQKTNSPHPAGARSDEHIAERPAKRSLCDPSLDIAIESEGYSLYGFDPVTKVGLVESVHIKHDFQRRGPAGAMVIAGINRLVEKGAEHIKISWHTETTGTLYLDVGFQQMSKATWYRAATG